MYKRTSLILLSLLSIILIPSLGFINPEPNHDTIQTNVVTYTLINAFPNLSFVRPVDFQSPIDGTNKIYVVEQAGKIYVFDNNNETLVKTLYLDIEAKVNDNGNEQGLLGLAFSPNFVNDGYLYIHYNLDTRSRISRYTHDTNTLLADPNSEFIIMEVNQPYSNHNGGQIAFGQDGMLYIGLGDGGSGGDPLNNGQNPNTLLGSLLRIDVENQGNGLNYSIPIDNPFVGVADHREEIYAYGLRNPWRFSFDTETEEIWLADVGQNQWEEVDKIIPGGNYGWNTMEGSHCYNPSTNCDMTGLILPVFEYDHTQGYSVTGGYVYRGSESLGLVGKYIFGDFSGAMWTIDVNTGEASEFIDIGTTIPSFGTDNDHELYILSFDGNIYKILETGYVPPISTTTSTSSETITITTVINDTTTTITSISEFTTTIVTTNPGVTTSVSNTNQSQDSSIPLSSPPSPLNVDMLELGLGVLGLLYIVRLKRKIT